jgi:hypothetical protein
MKMKSKGVLKDGFRHVLLYSSMHRLRQRLACEDCSKTFYSKSALVTHRVCIHLKIHPFKVTASHSPTAFSSGLPDFILGT